MVDHDKTAGHSIVNFKDVVTNHRHTLQDRMNVTCVTRSKVQRAVHQIESDMKQLRVGRDSVVKDLRSVMQAAHRELERCEQEVTSVILQQYEAQQRTLLDEQLRLHHVKSMLDKYIGHSEELLKTCHINEMAYMTGKLTKTAEKARSDLTVYEAGGEYLSSDIITHGTPLNERLCGLKDEYSKAIFPTNVALKISTCTPGFKSVITATLLNAEGNTVPIAGCFLTIIITDPWENKLSVTLNATDPECTVTFTPQRSGRHNIAVIYLGHKLTSEQTHINVKSNDPVQKFGGPGDGNGTLNSPRGIAIDNNGCLYVADTGNGPLTRYVKLQVAHAPGMPGTFSPVADFKGNR